MQYFQASDSKGSSLSLLKYLDPVEKQKRDTARSKQRKDSEHTVQLTEVEAFFIMKGDLLLTVINLSEKYISGLSTLVWTLEYCSYVKN